MPTFHSETDPAYLQDDWGEQITARAYAVDIQDCTVMVRYDLHGDTYDLNVAGSPIEDESDLIDFIFELHHEGYYGTVVRNNLLADCQ